MNRKHMVSVLAGNLVICLSLNAAVCRIGGVSFDSLADAVAQTLGRDATIVLLDDVTLTEPIVFPRTGSGHLCTVDGQGHTIYQGARQHLFSQAQSATYVSFTNVTFCGGGEAMSTADDATEGWGTLFRIGDSSCEFTLDADCVVSNFVVRGPLIYVGANSFKVNEGALITHNRASANNVPTTAVPYAGGVFELTTGMLTMDGGEISHNEGWYGAVAFLYKSGSSFTMNGGVIRDNVCLQTSGGNSGVVNCYANKTTFTMNGGLITANTSTKSDTSATRNTAGGKISGVVLYGDTSVFNMNGGAIVANEGVGVFAWGAVNVKGHSFLVGNGSYSGYVQNGTTPHISLVGDFTGYWELASSDTTAWNTQENAHFGTNSGSYSGSTNFRIFGTPSLMGMTNDSGEIRSGKYSIAKINGKGYYTLASALAAATDGTTITLLKDCFETMPFVPPAVRLTLDGGGLRLIRSSADGIFDFTAAGADLTLKNMTVSCGAGTCAVSDGDVSGAVARMHEDAPCTLTLQSGVTFVDGFGTKALFALAEGSTISLDGVTLTGQRNRIVDAPGGTLGIKGATVVKDNQNGDLDVATGTILHQTGDFTGEAMVSVAGVGPTRGQAFGLIDGDFTGFDRFLHPDKPKLFVQSVDGVLSWGGPGLILLFH